MRNNRAIGVLGLMAMALYVKSKELRKILNYFLVQSLETFSFLFMSLMF